MNVQKPLEILIFGTGAIGSTLGWRLAQNPLAKISVVCRSNYSAVRHCGIHLTTQLWGSGTFTPHRVVRSTHEVSYIPFDYVICANKATGPSLVHELAPAISAKTALVSVQNGVGVEAPLRQAFRDNTVLSAVCYISCTQPTPGCVEQVSHIRPHAFHIGTYSSSPSFTNPNVLQDFVALDPKFKQINNVQAERWTKQIFNGAWNPTTAITNLNTHDLLSSPHLHMVKQLATETFNVARALGIDLPDDLPERTIELAREHKALEPSMLQDRRAGRRMEVEALCGNIIRQAEQVGVSVPTVRTVYHLLLEIDERMRDAVVPMYAAPERLLGYESGAIQALAVSD